MTNSFSRLTLLVFTVCLPLVSSLGVVQSSDKAIAASTPSRTLSAFPKSARLTFRRIFKSSTPEFIEVVVHEDSDAATYEIRQLEEEASAQPFDVSAALRARMFALATQLNHFKDQDLDVHRKIANLGEKTFRWEKGTEAHEVKFNYTLNSAATQLLQVFEGLARQQEHVMLISRRMRYDRLGINDALLQFEIDLNRKLLPEPQRALPILDQIGSDSRFVDIARQRARNLAERIRHQS
ncbi:MAG TPA: hypothetical protein VOA64_06185 [Candidatus Dormibacteraeota bacterium]|nr:hypothetical protein [Candidatus Dormibacteraeota bacterium]